MLFTGWYFASFFSCSAAEEKNRNISSFCVQVENPVNHYEYVQSSTTSTSIIPWKKFNFSHFLQWFQVLLFLVQLFQVQNFCFGKKMDFCVISHIDIRYILNIND